MNKINSSYYRLGIVIGLCLLCVLVYTIFSFYKLKKGSAEIFNNYYQNVSTTYEGHQFDLRMAQLAKAIGSMKAIESGMDRFSNLQVNQSIDELQLLQQSLDKNLVSSDVLNVILSRSLHTHSLGQIRSAKTEILKNNV